MHSSQIVENSERCIGNDVGQLRDIFLADGYHEEARLNCGV